MGLQGTVKVEHRDKNGRLKHYINKHNTITELGKASALFFGVTALADDNVTLSPKFVLGYPMPDEDMITSGTMQKSGTVECLLLSDQASSIAAKDRPELFVPSASNIIGFAANKTTSDTLDSKEGIRVTTSPASALGNKVQLAYYWEGLEGDVNTIGMRMPPFAIYHNISDFFNTTYNFIPQGQCDVPSHCIAAGGSTYNRLLNLDSLSLSDFVPAGTADDTNVKCVLEHNGYTIYFLYNEIRVIKDSTGDTYTETWTGLKGLFIKSGVLYAYTRSGDTATLYSCTVSDNEITASPVSDPSTVINPEHMNAKMYGSYVNIYGVADGAIAYNKEVQGSQYLVIAADIVAADYSIIYYSDITPFVVCGNIIYQDLNMISAAGQYGWLYSYFDLEQTWQIETTDTVKVSYTYELTEVV